MASAYPSRPKLSAIVQQATLNRAGLVADCIFPQVKTDCKFSYIDWSQEVNGLKLISDAVGCKTNVHEVDSTPFILVDKSLADHALAQALGECCVNVCGDDGAYNSKIEAGKTRQLMNKLLIQREKRAITLATTLGNYVDQGVKLPTDPTAAVEGGRFNITQANVNDPNFKLLRWFLGIQENLKTGGNRNVMITDRATLNAILAHPNFIGSGCAVDPMTTADNVAAILGLSKICIADATYNDGLEAVPNMVKLWPAGYILFTTSYDFVTAQDETFAFGISAYNRGMQQYNWEEKSKGPTSGVVMQKISHDLTEVVLSYKAATLVVVSP